MKKRPNVMFAGIFVGSVLICSLVLVLVFNLIKNEDEGKVKEVSVAASQGMIELSSNDESKEVEAKDAPGKVDDKAQPQARVQDNDNEKGNGLISGLEDISAQVNGVKKITISAAVDEVTVYQGDGEKLEITQIYKNIDKDDLVSVTELGDELMISTSYTDSGFQLPGIYNYNRSSQLKINLPKGYEGKLDVSTDVGNVYIENELQLESAVINCDVGNIIVKSTQKMKKATLSTDVGNVEIQEEWNVETSSVAANVGNVTLYKAVKADKLFIDVDMGNIIVPEEVRENENYSISTDFGEIMTTDDNMGIESNSFLKNFFDQG